MIYSSLLYEFLLCGILRQDRSQAGQRWSMFGCMHMNVMCMSRYLYYVYVYVYVSCICLCNMYMYIVNCICELLRQDRSQAGQRWSMFGCMHMNVMCMSRYLYYVYVYVYVSCICLCNMYMYIVNCICELLRQDRSQAGQRWSMFGQPAPPDWWY